MRQSSRLLSQYLLVIYRDFLVKQIEFLQVDKDKIVKRDIKVDIIWRCLLGWARLLILNLASIIFSKSDLKY